MASRKYGVRNAGNVFMFNGDIYRPGQDCVNSYGDGLVFWRGRFRDGIYNEQESCRIGVGEIPVSSTVDKYIYCGVHTYNQSQNYEVIDLKLRKKNSFCQRISIVIRSVFKRLETHLHVR